MEQMKFSIKELRARHDLTQQKAADKLGVSIQTYNAWENNFGMVKARNAYKLAELFGVKLDDIFFSHEHENDSCKN